jgi:DNA-binding response OmpR family regulator
MNTRLEQEQVWVISNTLPQAQAVAHGIDLRQVDAIQCYTYADLKSLPSNPNPNILILDLGKQNQQAPQALLWMETLSSQEPLALALAESFDEDLFFNLYDQGVREYLVKPLRSSYLMARILGMLQDLKTRKQLQYTENLLTSLGVLAPFSRCYQLPYWQEILQTSLTEQLSSSEPTPFVVAALQFHTAQNQAPGWLNNQPKAEQLLGQALRSALRACDAIGQSSPGAYWLYLPNLREHTLPSVEKRIRSYLQSFLTQVEAPNEAPTQVALSVRCVGESPQRWPQAGSLLEALSEGLPLKGDKSVAATSSLSQANRSS